MKLNILKLHSDAICPSYGSEYSAGLDINSYLDYEIPPNSRKLISTGISFALSGDDSINYYLRVAPRSGLSVKFNIDIGAGVIDYDYRGEIFVCLINNDNKNTFVIKKGDRIAQLIPTKIIRFENIEVVNELPETNRGNKGFGSTGI